MKRIATLSIIAVLVLLTIGTTFAAWTRNITLEASVATGTFDIKWQDVALDRSEEPVYDGSPVAEVTMDVVEDSHKITYTVTNAYPGWTSKIKAKVVNTGSVPANLAATLVKSSEEIEVTGFETINGTLAGGAVSPERTITVRIPESVETQNGSYTFTVTVAGTQWNIIP